MSDDEDKLWQDGGEDEIYISSLPRIEREVVTHTTGSRRLRAKKSNSLELARYSVHAFTNSKIHFKQLYRQVVSESEDKHVINVSFQVELL